MQYNFQEGLLCGLLMTHDSVSYNSNKNYRPLSDPLFKYILENYTPKVEIIMTSHYTYKYYNDVSPFYSNDDILLWDKIEHSIFRMRTDSNGDIIAGPYNYAQGTMFHSFHKAINSQTAEHFTLKVWYRDGKPIIGNLSVGQIFAGNDPRFHDKYITVDGKIVYLGTICYPRYAIKDMTITQSDPIGTFEQAYRVRSGKIVKKNITMPEGAVNPPTITVTFNRGINMCHPSNYDSMIFIDTGGGGHVIAPESPPADWSGDPVIFSDSFEQKTYTVRGDSMSTAPDFSIATGGNTPWVFCELTADEFHECELELINQQYEKAKSKYRVYDIPSFLLPKGFTNKDLPPEINRTLPTT